MMTHDATSIVHFSVVLGGHCSEGCDVTKLSDRKQFCRTGMIFRGVELGILSALFIPFLYATFWTFHLTEYRSVCPIRMEKFADRCFVCPITIKEFADLGAFCPFRIKVFADWCFVFLIRIEEFAKEKPDLTLVTPLEFDMPLADLSEVKTMMDSINIVPGLIN